MQNPSDPPEPNESTGAAPPGDDSIGGAGDESVGGAGPRKAGCGMSALILFAGPIALAATAVAILGR